MSSSDWIFDNSEFLGNFEGLYQNELNPWGQLETGPDLESRRMLAVSHCERVRFVGRPTTTIELGCGFGLLTSELANRGFNAHGVDISETAIKRASSCISNATFHNFDVTEFNKIRPLNPDIIVMAEITWYILPELSRLLNNFRDYSRERKDKVYLFHSLTTYSPGVQKYGLDYFTNLEEILAFFDFDFIEYGTIVSTKNQNSFGTYFFAEINSD